WGPARSRATGARPVGLSARSPRPQEAVPPPGAPPAACAVPEVAASPWNDLSTIGLDVEKPLLGVDGREHPVADLQIPHAGGPTVEEADPLIGGRVPPSRVRRRTDQQAAPGRVAVPHAAPLVHPYRVERPHRTVASEDQVQPIVGRQV